MSPSVHQPFHARAGYGSSAAHDSLVGVGLAFLVVQANAPGWVFPLVFFAPPALFTVLFAAVFLPRVIREMREAARNHSIARERRRGGNWN